MFSCPVDGWNAKLKQSFHFIPPAGAQAKVTQHKEITALPKFFVAFAPGGHVVSHSECIRNGVQIGVSNIAPPPDHQQAETGFREQEQQLRYEEEQKYMLTVLQNDKQVVPISKVPLGLRRTSFNNSCVAGGIYASRTTMVKSRRGEPN